MTAFWGVKHKKYENLTLQNAYKSKRYEVLGQIEAPKHRHFSDNFQKNILLDSPKNMEQLEI